MRTEEEIKAEIEYVKKEIDDIRKTLDGSTGDYNIHITGEFSTLVVMLTVLRWCLGGGTFVHDEEKGER